MGFSFEHRCPQCGAPIQLDETDRVLACRYCGVRSVLEAEPHHRFTLGGTPADHDVLWAPYHRFRGNAFACTGDGIETRVLDLSSLAFSSVALPATLGFRPQTQALRLLGPDTPGRFLRENRKLGATLEAADVLASRGRRVHLRTYIGEAVSTIYLPLVVQGRNLVDGISGDVLARLPAADALARHTTARHPGAALRALAALCPHCGGTLAGEGDSAVMICPNCQRAWEPAGGRFAERAIEIPGPAVRATGTRPALDRPARAGTTAARAITVSGGTVHLPFWRIEPEATGLRLATCADFGRLVPAFLPARATPSAPLRLWSPAFKVNGDLLLRLASRLTVAQPTGPGDGRLLRRPPRLHPITLPLAEAASLMPLIVADLAARKDRIYPRLGALRIETARATLVYVPFEEAGQEVVHRAMALAIARNALSLGRLL